MSHALAEEVIPGARTFEDVAWTIIYTYLFAWSAALVISYRTVFERSAST